MLFLVIACGYVLGLRYAGATISQPSNEYYNISAELGLGNLKGEFFQPFKVMAKSRKLVKLTFNITHQAQTPLHGITLYYKENTSSHVRSSKQRGTSDSFWIDLHLTSNGTRTYIGRARNRQINKIWWKIKIPKKPFKNIFQLNNDRKIVFDLDLKGSSRHPINMNSTVLQIETIKDHNSFVEKDSDQEQITSPVNYPRCMGQCCLQPLTINFDEIGHEWILYPKQYTANYCSGSCSSSYMTIHEKAKLTMQSRATELMLAKLNLPSAGISCVAGSATPVKMLYRDHNDIIRSTYNSLKTITSCKCA